MEPLLMSTPCRCLRRRGGPPWPVLWAALIAAGLWLLLPALASAHAVLIASNLLPGTTIRSAPSVAQWVFSEPLNPTLTQAEVIDAAGHVLTASPGRLAPGTTATWQVPLPRLADGAYTVAWTSESATDGHVAKSSYPFRIAPTGAAPRSGPVPDALNGDPGSGSAIALPRAVAPYILVHWITLAAGAAWLGALVITLLVLHRSRQFGAASEQRLAALAMPRVWRGVQIAPAVTFVALLGEQVAFGYDATDRWGRALAPATIVGELGSQYGRVAAIRLILLLAALVLALLVRSPTAGRTSSPQWGPTPQPQQLGIVGPSFGRPAGVGSTGLALTPLLTGLALVYMLLVAWSGHAVDLSPLWLALAVDWAHLVGAAAWIGGIAALAWGVLPLQSKLPPRQRAYAVLPLLARFSPIAYAAVAGLVLSGIYNAVSHLSRSGPVTGELASTIYGQLALLKSALVIVLAGLSASHTYLLRPWIARMERAAAANEDERGTFEADAEAGLGALAERVRFEAYIGTVIFLAAAAMAETLPG